MRGVGTLCLGCASVFTFAGWEQSFWPPGAVGASVGSPKQSCAWVMRPAQGLLLLSEFMMLPESWIVGFPSLGSPSHFHRDFRSAGVGRCGVGGWGVGGIFASNGSSQACPVPFVEVEFNFSLSRESSAPSCPLSCSHQLENELWELSPWSRNPR